MFLAPLLQQLILTEKGFVRHHKEAPHLLQKQKHHVYYSVLKCQLKNTSKLTIDTLFLTLTLQLSKARLSDFEQLVFPRSASILYTIMLVN